MSTLANLLQEAGYTPAGGVAERARLVPASTPSRDKAGTLEPAETLGVPAVPAVPGGNRRERGKVADKLQSAGDRAAADRHGGNVSARARLVAVAKAAGLDARRVVRLDDATSGELAALTEAELQAYAVALDLEAQRHAGRVPEGWDAARVCLGCGPVWLWPEAPARVLACPWCAVRVRCRHYPTPEVQA